MENAKRSALSSLIKQLVGIEGEEVAAKKKPKMAAIEISTVEASPMKKKSLLEELREEDDDEDERIDEPANIAGSY